ncbi:MULTISPECIES: hypothetical protein [unclassified Mesorhizobium]|uniref:hypothetical protein n=1 Tax=unclassified Mesorhizobium TaxID=325217 RepID=UPI000F763E8E|nr:MULTISPECIES: hypothetical protein [unclassified Mesorhizobium]AZO68940.1 hypothetical protein EJ075_31195 [Mesorhizobium sp. M6A.T.Cr.TU.016.01.1.1]RWP45417.1 MAG: hypothetical protein EOR06_31320 [Mesorhizobium sp.]RWQ69290.1 MAG: hypothetical protein EOS85_29575 [Mesorhizobium sp.]
MPATVARDSVIRKMEQFMFDESKLESEITPDAVDFSFGELLNLHRGKEIIIRPEYQIGFGE